MPWQSVGGTTGARQANLDSMARYTSGLVLAGALLQGGLVGAQGTSAVSWEGLMLTIAALPNGNVTAVTCPSTAKFNTITAAAHFAGMNPGWNLGNTLDAVETVRTSAPS